MECKIKNDIGTIYISEDVLLKGKQGQGVLERTLLCCPSDPDAYACS